jgi:hypothetical protein
VSFLSAWSVVVFPVPAVGGTFFATFFVPLKAGYIFGF